MSTELLLDRSLTARINLYYDVRPAPQSPAPLLIALHGYSGNKEQMMREAKLFAPDNFAIASLQGIHQHIIPPRDPKDPLRFGFGWLTNFRSEESVAIHHQAILDLINHLTEEGIANPKRVFLLGFSQSVALNYRFAFTHPERVCGVIGICGGIPGDWETSGLYRQATFDILHLAGKNDEFYPITRARDFENQLKKRASHVVFKSYDGPHRIVPEMRDDVVQWLTRRQR